MSQVMQITLVPLDIENQRQIGPILSTGLREKYILTILRSFYYNFLT